MQGKSSPSSNVVEGEMLDTVEEAECREGEEETWFFGLPELSHVLRYLFAKEEQEQGERTKV